MKTLKIIFWIIIGVTILLIPQIIINRHPIEVKTIELQAAPVPDTVVGMIDYIAPQFGQDPQLISKIAWCESGHKVKSHDGGRAVNITGIHDRTFDGWLPLYKADRGETLNKDSTFDQIKMMSWAFSKGSSYRNQWTTYVAYTKGGTYAFYSRLLKDHFVVKCS